MLFHLFTFFSFIFASDLIHPVHKPLEVTVGSEVVIDIEENPSTGYSMELYDESYGVNGFLSYVSDFRVERNAGEENMVGVPVIHRFVFRGEKCGMGKVHFIKARFGKVDASATLETYFIHVVMGIVPVGPEVVPDTGGIIHPVHKPLQVTVGSEVAIEIPENPTTGYTWMLFDKSFAVGGFVSFVSESLVKIDTGDENTFGAPSMHRFVFRGEKCGTIKVLLVMGRFGQIEADAQPESYFIHVVEKPDTQPIIPN